MERLALLVEENVKRLNTVSLPSAGIFIKLALHACVKTGDGIELGTVENWGREPTEHELTLMCSCDSKTIVTALSELKKADLIALNPLRIKHFRDDNSAYIGRRRSNIDRQTETERVPNGNQTKSGTKPVPRVDKTRRDKTSKDGLPVETAPPSDNPEDVFMFYYHRLKGHEFSWLAKLVKEYGSPKFNQAVKVCGLKGYAKGRIDEYLEGDGKFSWEKKQKPGRRNRHRVDKA